jgi:hypothetical protein
MNLFQVTNSKDITNMETVGEEIKYLHRQRKNAQLAINRLPWFPSWGKKPILEVSTIDRYETEEDAINDGWIIVD